MILRVWRGYGAVADAEAYPKHLFQTVRPKLEQLDGFRGRSSSRCVAGEWRTGCCACGEPLAGEGLRPISLVDQVVRRE